jgi:hypothetical protein
MKLERMIPSERELPERRLAVRKTQLVKEIAAWNETSRRRRQRRILILVPAVLAILVATGFTTYALIREPTVYESVGCFERAAMNANVAVVPADGRDPAVICGEVFEASGMNGTRFDTLASCVLDSGAIGVFPSGGPGTCEQLGLADVPASYAAERKRFGALRDAIIAQIGEPASGSTRGGPQCVGEDESLLIVRRELDSHGYLDWDVKVAGEGFSARRPCADVSLDTAGRTVLLVANGPR